MGEQLIAQPRFSSGTTSNSQFLVTYIHIHININTNRRNQMHNPAAYAHRVNNIWSMLYFADTCGLVQLLFEDMAGVTRECHEIESVVCGHCERCWRKAHSHVENNRGELLELFQNDSSPSHQAARHQCLSNLSTQYEEENTSYICRRPTVPVLSHQHKHNNQD